ncbi:MAG TPA: ATP-binding protein [Steroidobacteraceae bacterium]|jgi:signal transduction histidine kinase/ActR/RegA family two-component response regulator
MNTIHDDRMGSEVKHLAALLKRERRARARLGRAKDALEMVLGTGCVGFCKIQAARPRLSANAHFKAHFGWPPDALLERGDLEARVHQEDRAALAQAIAAALEQGTPLELTVRAVWRCGTTQFIALRGRCALADQDENGARARSSHELVLVASNVSAEHLALQQFKALALRESALATHAASANRVNLELLARISHELRSPLNSVLGWNRILAIKRGDDPEIKDMTARVEHGAKVQLRILNEVLDLAHMGVGKFRIDARPMKLAMVVATAIEGASAAAQAKDIEIIADLAATCGAINGDSERLRQVVAHLLSNAVKFTPAGGKIRIWLRPEGSDFELGVADSGCGITRERLPHVFDRAHDGDRSAGSLGVGLALAREIVRLHGGTLRMSSEGADCGATVVVCLPGRTVAAVAGASIPAPDAGAPRPLSGLGILVVDDEPDARAVVAELLRLQGAEVAVSDSAASAYEKLSAKGASFDVVVTDIGMPFEDGYSLVRRLRALQSGNRVVAIALTGLASTHDAATALAAGFDLHVAKPVDFERFVPMICRLSPGTAHPHRASSARPVSAQKNAG